MLDKIQTEVVKSLIEQEKLTDIRDIISMLPPNFDFKELEGIVEHETIDKLISLDKKIDEYTAKRDATYESKEHKEEKDKQRAERKSVTEQIMEASKLDLEYTNEEMLEALAKIREVKLVRRETTIKEENMIKIAEEDESEIGG